MGLQDGWEGGWGRPPPIGSCQTFLNLLTAALRRRWLSSFPAGASPHSNTFQSPLQRGAGDPVTLNLSFITQSCLPKEPRALPQSSQMPPAARPKGTAGGRRQGDRHQTCSEQTSPPCHLQLAVPILTRDHSRLPSALPPPVLCVDLITEVSVPAGVSL